MNIFTAVGFYLNLMLFLSDMNWLVWIAQHSKNILQIIPLNFKILGENTVTHLFAFHRNKSNAFTPSIFTKGQIFIMVAFEGPDVTKCGCFLYRTNMFKKLLNQNQIQNSMDQHKHTQTQTFGIIKDTNHERWSISIQIQSNMVNRTNRLFRQKFWLIGLRNVCVCGDFD